MSSAFRGKRATTVQAVAGGRVGAPAPNSSTAKKSCRSVTAMAWNPFAQDSAKAGVVGSQAGGIENKHKALDGCCVPTNRVRASELR